MNPKLQKFLAGGSAFPAALFYIVGIVWFCLLSQDELNHETYLSENALLVGQVVERFDDAQSTMEYYNQVKQFYPDSPSYDSSLFAKKTAYREWLAQQLESIGLEVYTQNFTFTYPVLYPERERHGYNLYAIMRSPSGGRTEAILLTVSLENVPDFPPAPGSAAVLLSLLKTLRQQIYWAKDIVVLFPEYYYIGLIPWIEAYHGGEQLPYLSWTELEGRSGNIQAGLNLEFASPDVTSVDICPVGTNGLLANLDLVNTIVRLAHRQSIQPVVNGQTFRFTRGDPETRMQDFAGLTRAVWNQASGLPSGLHGLLINYQIPAVTLLSPSRYLTWPADRHGQIVRTGKFVEGILRSLNNLQERMHQSFWYYLLPNPLRYISIGVYMPPVLVLIGSLLIKVLGFWIPLPTASSSPTTSPPATDVGPETKPPTELSDTVTRSTDSDQTVRKRQVSRPDDKPRQPKKPEPDHAESATQSPSDLLTVLADITVWLIASLATGFGLFLAPKLWFVIRRIFITYRNQLRGYPELDLPAMLCLCWLSASAVVPLVAGVVRRRFERRSTAITLWKRSIVLVSWTLFLACTACLNVSASLLLSIPIVAPLLLFVHPHAQSRLRSLLFGLCWLLVSPAGLIVWACLLQLTVFDETLPPMSQTVSFTKLWGALHKGLMVPIMGSDLFGCWSWPVMTVGFSSLWMLTWLDLCWSG